MKKNKNFAVGIAIVAAAIALAIGYQKRGQFFSKFIPAGNQQKSSISSEPILIEILGEARSLDGTKKLTMQRITNRNNETQMYSFSTSDSSSPIFTKTMDLSGSMSIPVNSWSPDNKYVFIEEKNEQGEKSYLVLKANGEPVAKDQPYYDVKELWTTKKIKYALDEATGWASETLLILTTKKDDGTAGFSYWFEVPSKAFLQLSR